jgi:hypothetical protein
MIRSGPTTRAMLRIHRRPPAMIRFLPWLAFEEGVFLLSDGRVGVGWEVTPRPVEGMSAREVEEIYDRVESALLALPRDGTVSGQVLAEVRAVRQDDPLLAAHARSEVTEGSRSELVCMLARARRRRLQEGGRGFWPGNDFRTRSLSVHLFLALDAGWRETSPLLTFLKDLPALGEGGGSSVRRLEAATARMLEIAAAFESAMAAAAGAGSDRIGMRRTTEDDLVRLVWPRLNPAWDAAGVPPPEKGPRATTIRSRVACTEAVVEPEGLDLGDGWRTRVLSFLQLPFASRPGMFDHLLACGEDLVLSVGFHLRETAREVGILEFKRFLAFSRRRTPSGDTSIPGEVLKRDLDEALRAVHEGNAALVRVVPSVALTRRGEEALRRSVHRVASVIAQIQGAEPYLERHLGAQAWFGTLPFGFHHRLEEALQRDVLLPSSNLIHFLTLSGRWRGNHRPEEEDARGATARPRVLLHDRDGDLAVFEPFTASAPHTVIAASTGAGKSFLANLILSEVLRAGGRVYVIDLGGSYRRLCSLVEGQYVEVGIDRPLAVNPFDVRWPDHDAVAMLVGLLRLMTASAGRGVDRLTEEALLEKAVRRAYRDRGWALEDPTRDARGQEVLLRHVAAALREEGGEDLALRLYRYVEEGSYARFFDRPNQVEFDRPLVVFDLQGLKRYPDLQAVYLLTVMSNINARMQDPALRDTPKVLVADESWSLLQDEDSARYIEAFSRTARKVGGMLLGISQSLLDWQSGPAGRVILQNSPNRIYLRQQREDLERMRELLGLEPEEVDIIASLATVKGRYSEFYLKTETGRGVMRYVPSAEEYWTFTTDAEDAAAFQRALEEHQGDVVAAVSACARRWPFGLEAARRGDAAVTSPDTAS